MYLYIIFTFNDFLERTEIVACSTDYYYIRRLRKKYDPSLVKYKRIHIDKLFECSSSFSW